MREILCKFKQFLSYLNVLNMKNIQAVRHLSSFGNEKHHFLKAPFHTEPTQVRIMQRPREQRYWCLPCV